MCRFSFYCMCIFKCTFSTKYALLCSKRQKTKKTSALIFFCRFKLWANCPLLLHPWSTSAQINVTIYLYTPLSQWLKRHTWQWITVKHRLKKEKKNQKQALYKKHWLTHPTSLVIGAISLFMLDCLPKCQPIYFPHVAFFSFFSWTVSN